MRKSKNNSYILVKRAMVYVKPYKVRFISAFICVLTVTILGLVQPILWGKILAKLFEKNFYSGLNYIFLLLIFYVFRYLISFYQSYLFSFLNENIIVDIKKDLYKKILNLPIKAFDEIKVGEFISRMHGDTAEIANIITNQFLNTFVDVIKVVCIGIIVFTISIPLSLIVVFVFPFSYLLFVKFGKILRRRNKELSRLSDVYYGNITESINAIREIKGLGIKDHKFQSFYNLISTSKKKKIEMTIMSNISIVLSNFLNLLSLIGVMSLGGYFIYKGMLTMDYYIAFSSYSSEFSSSLMNITKLNSNVQQMITSLERIFGLMDNLNYSTENFGSEYINSLKGDINFDNVCFEYNKGFPVLNNISFNINSNSKVAIVGSSGSGKTTIFNLLTKFYDVTNGKITIDNININDISENSLRNNITIVRQEPYIFHGSIKENLLLVNPKATDDEIFAATQSAYIHDYITSLPNGYDTLIGENGVNLSGGQKQRLAIARALLKNSQIILLDEATSALDNDSQQYIKKAVDQISKNHTVIIIAHRLSTIIEADNIIVIEKSKIVGQGVHDLLIKNNPTYKRLYETEGGIANNVS